MSTPNRQVAVYTNPGDLKKFLETGRGVVAAALPKHLNPDRMLRLALTAFSTTPALRECTGVSILSSIVVASQLGLEPGVAGQGYLIPYGGKCTFVPGWQGLVGLLNNSGRATAWTGAVFEGDVWDFQLGSSPRCIHVPGDNFGDPEKMTWVYACGQVNGSQLPVIEAWPMSRVWKHRDRFNKVGRRHYSFEHPEMYARKVVLLQVLKYMPRSIELNNALVAANAAEEGRTVKVEEGTVIEDHDSSIPEGNVGSGAVSISEIVNAEKPPTAQDSRDTAPTAKELYDTLIGKAAKLDAGPGKLAKKLVELKLIKPDDKLDKLDAKDLANLLDAWDDIAAALTAK